MPDGSPRSTRRRSSGSASRSSAPTHRRQGSPCPARRGGGPWIPDHRPVARSSPSLLASVGAVGCRVRGSHWWRGPSVSTHHLRRYTTTSAPTEVYPHPPGRDLGDVKRHDQLLLCQAA